MEVQRTTNSLNKRNGAKQKYKSRNRNCDYEMLPQDMSNLQILESEDTLVNNVNLKDEPSEALTEESALLESEGRDLESAVEDRNPTYNISAYTPDFEYTLVTNPEVVETELKEIKSQILILPNNSNRFDTTLDSPIHLPIIHSSECPPGELVGSSEDTEIAHEVCPSAPVIHILTSNVDLSLPKQFLKPYLVFANKENIGREDVKPFTLLQLQALYHNEELDYAQYFVTQFIDSELKRGDIIVHPLYELLSNYQRAREKLSVNNTEVMSLRQACQEHESQLWSLEKCVVTELGECQDGNPVSASHQFQTAHYNKAVATDLYRCLCSLRELISESYTLAAYTCEVVKFQVDHYIQQEEARFSLPHNAPVTLLQEVTKGVTELKEAVSVLFAFQRHMLNDEGFVKDTRNWLTRLVAVLIRVSTWKEHLFLLHHILRCPAGVSKWAVSFIQVPVSTYSPAYLDHLITCLASILQPVQTRDAFLSGMTDSEDTTHTWVLIDSDGEDQTDINGLRESDMVAFLNQIPFGDIFRQVMRLGEGSVTEEELLKLIVLSSMLVCLLDQGLRSDSANHNQQYAKRLGRLVRHTIDYVTDQYQLFRNQGQVRDHGKLSRVIVEYNALLSRAVHTLYHSPGHTSWQFLAVLPFDAVSTDQLWNIFCFLLLGDDEPADEQSWHSKLSDQLNSLSDAEIYYLLTALHSMALSRPSEDWHFIEATTLQLLEIGFLNPSTKDTCFKSSRIMLLNLTSKHPQLISKIIEWIDMSIHCGKLCVYLVKELPLSLWNPTNTDLYTLECWLLQNSFTAVKHILARCVISGLNLGTSSGEHSHKLFLDRSVHVHIAMMLLKAAVQFCPQSPPEGSSISSTFKQVTGSFSPGSTPELALLLWLWKTVLRLRLHLLDQSNDSVQQTLANPGGHLSDIPDLESSSPEVELVAKHLKSHQAMAVYMSLQMTSLGHCVPVICNQGFSLLSVLQSCQLHTAVLSVIQHMIPLFLDCSSSILGSEKFRSVLLSLLFANKTFFKTAKTLISPDPPGEILLQFGDMIHYHLDNYSRYNIQSPTPLAQLWLQILCTVWSEEPCSVSYLMDVLLSYAFFHPEMAAMALDNLSQLYQSLISTPHANSRLSSLFQWMSRSASGQETLVPQGGSWPHSPWFSYFALQVEQLHIQETNGVWRELVKELALNKNKLTVDAALKKVTAALKIASFPSSALSVYRWSQQILETSIDHPVLPLIWQRLFILTFTRYVTPNGLDQGSVGDKLFEGTSNQSLHKRLKRKLIDCVENFRAKASLEDITSEKYLLCDSLSKSYETFMLWLDEDRLHEPGLYIPALSAQYNTYKLIALTSAADQNPWFEYVDYEKVQTLKNTSIRRWNMTLHRHMQPPPSPPTVSKEPDPVRRIYKRLSSYDCPVAPPPLHNLSPIVTPLSRDAIVHKDVMMDNLKPFFKALLQYAQSHSLRISEQSSLDCRLLELLPTLYYHSESEITLYAACDSLEPRTKQPHADDVCCAGPAEIHIKVRPATRNLAVKQEVDTNRNELNTLLKYSIQSPPTNICIAGIQIEQAARVLESEFQELKRIGDIQLLESVKKVGTALFYQLTDMYKEDVATYPPLRQLVTSCIHILGDAFISGSESESTRLLFSLLNSPQLSGMLSPHFTPSVASPATFIHMYSILVDCDKTSPDLLFVLLSKFDVALWLREQKPRLAERSQMIELVGRALALAGNHPDLQYLMLHGVYRRHVCTLFMHDFPEHYGEVLALMLHHSETQSVASDSWFDLINALAGSRCQTGLSLVQLKEIMHKYATEQRALSHKQLKDTASMLGNHFTKERLQYGLYGLYPKYRLYTEPLATLQGMVAHALVVSTLHSDRGSLAEKLCARLWPPLCELFSPWLAPYYTRNLSEPTAAWIEQLTDDRSVLPPWVVADAAHAHLMTSMFIECIRFIIDTLPVASSHVLSCLWQFYVTHYAHSSVKPHVLNIIHQCFASLPWGRFLPSLQDIDLMLKVVDQYLPDCHVFLGMVFIEVSWPQWVPALTEFQTPQVNSGVHAAILHLLIKLANEPNVRQSGAVTQLLLRCRTLSWHMVDCSSYEPVVNWFIMSYDPRVVHQTTGDTDSAALDLLEVAAGFTLQISQFHYSTPRKRHIYIRAYVKLLLLSMNRFKNFASNHGIVKSVVHRILDKINTIIVSCVAEAQKVPEAALLLTEVLALMSGPVANQALEAVESWISIHSASSVVVVALLKVLPISVMDPNMLGPLLESTLTAFFRSQGDVMGSWSTTAEHFQPLVPHHDCVEDSFAANGHLLSLYIVTLKNTPKPLDTREEACLLNTINQWLPKVNVSEKTEAKLPLLWSHVLFLCFRQCDNTADPMPAGLTLKVLTQSVTQVLEHRAGTGWGILGAIGLVKSSVSNRFRVMGRFLVALILAQMFENKGLVIRYKPFSPEFRECPEATKALAALESLTSDKSYAEWKMTVEHAVRLVRKPENSLHNAHQLVLDVGRLLYPETFLHAHAASELPH